MLYSQSKCSSASQMTAVKVMDVIVRLPACAGQAAAASSAKTQVKNEGHSKNIFSFQSQSVQIYGCVFHDTNGRNHGQTLKIQCFVLNGICADIHLLGSREKDSSRKVPLELIWEQVPDWNAYLCIVSKVYGLRG